VGGYLAIEPNISVNSTIVVSPPEPKLDIMRSVLYGKSPLSLQQHVCLGPVPCTSLAVFPSIALLIKLKSEV
jgi:hypothetical protein